MSAEPDKEIEENSIRVTKQSKQVGIENHDITEPFKTRAIDVNGETPVSEIPDEYYRNYKQDMKNDYVELKALEQCLEELAVNPDIENFVMQQVNLTVSKQDNHVVNIAFHVALSTLIKPMHLALKCESGSGKTYGTVETIKFLPPELSQHVGSQSPKVISHENGIRKSQDGELIEESKAPQKPMKSDYSEPQEYSQAVNQYIADKEKWRDKLAHSYYEVDLRNKIILFLESINPETFKMLKSTMSADNPFIDHKFVDDKGQVHVTRLIGSPVLIFNSVDTGEYIEEFATRTFTATPNTSREKIEDAMRISNLKSCYPWKYEKELFNKRLIQEYIRKIKFYVEKGKLKVANVFDGISEGFSKDATRDMRDFNKFLELMPSFALFKLFQRPIMTICGQRYIIPTIQDAIDAKNCFDSILETTQTGTDQRIIEFYHSVVADKVNGSTAEILTDEYNKSRPKSKPKDTRTIRKWLNRLEELGWLDVREGTHENAAGYIDKRYNNYIPLKKNTPIMSFSDKNIVFRSILENSFEKWLKNMSFETDSPPDKIILLHINGTATEISLDLMKYAVLSTTPEKNSLGGEGKAEDILFKPKTKPKQENTVESMLVNAKNIQGVSFSRIIMVKPFKSMPGISCSKQTKDGACIFEATWNLNGNLFCEDHVKEEIKFCQENGTQVKLAPREDS
jgi:hypothetical protein